MGNENLKIDGFAQSIYEISATAKELVGCLRILADGRKFRYAQAGAGALVAGKMSAAPVLDTDFSHNACPAAAAIGDTDITVTHVATGTAYAADYFRGGYLMIPDQLVQYPIVSSSAISTTSTTIDLQLGQAIMIDLTAADHFNLVASPWRYVVQNATINMVPTGIPQVAVTALYYCWLQTGGIGQCLIDGSPAVGSMLIPDAVTGALEQIGTGTSTYDADAPYCAIALGYVADDYAATVHLLID